jgi:hypothetical protein
MGGFRDLRLALLVALCAAAAIPLPALRSPPPPDAFAAVSRRYVVALRGWLWREVPAARWATTRSSQ